MGRIGQGATSKAARAGSLVIDRWIDLIRRCCLVACVTLLLS
jgi:hypothetical protein